MHTFINTHSDKKHDSPFIFTFAIKVRGLKTERQYQSKVTTFLFNGWGGGGGGLDI